MAVIAWPGIKTHPADRECLVGLRCANPTYFWPDGGVFVGLRCANPTYGVDKD